LRTILIVALAAALAACSRQPPPPPQAVADNCVGRNLFACWTAVPVPMQPTSLALSTAPAEGRIIVAHQPAKPRLAQLRHRTRVAAKRAKPTMVAAKSETKSEALNSHAQLPPATPVKPPQPAAADTPPKQPDNATAPAPAAPPPPKSVQEQVALAAAEAAPAQANADTLVAVVLARPDIKSVADLKARNVAIDDRYSSSSTSVRTAIVAAGAPEVQLSQGQSTAINRLVNGEVPAAVVALEQPDAAERFPEIAGYRIFHIPLSPRSMKARP
jgi:hypothetical protein